MGAFAAVLRAAIVPKGTDSTGEISSGILVLQGKCLVGELQYSSSIADGVSTITVSCGPNSSIDIPAICVDASRNISNSFRYDILKSGVFLDYRVDDPGPHQVPDKSKVLLMKVDEISQYKPYEYVQGWLVLYQRDVEAMSYERIGVLKMVLQQTITLAMEHWYYETAKDMMVTIV
jgi:hypothetical protein